MSCRHDLTREEALHLLELIEQLGNMVDYGCLDKTEAKVHKSARKKLEEIAK